MVLHNGIYGYRFRKATTDMLAGIEPAESQSDKAVAPELAAFVNVVKVTQPAPPLGPAVQAPEAIPANTASNAPANNAPPTGSTASAASSSKGGLRS